MDGSNERSAVVASRAKESRSGGDGQRWMRLQERVKNSPWMPVARKVLGWIVAFGALAALGSGATSNVWPASVQTAAVLGAAPSLPIASADNEAQTPPVREPLDGGSSDAGAEEQDADAAAPTAGKLDLNRATEAELDALPGIGPAKARAIVELRQKLGRFRRLEELLRVKGIGRKRLAQLRPLLVVDAP